MGPGGEDLGGRLIWAGLDAPKHKGITYVAIDMHQPGVEVRPLRAMTGHDMFNEVFLTDARIPLDQVIGDVGGGWAVANTTLMFERSGLGSGGTSAVGGATPGTVAGHLDCRAEDLRGSLESFDAEEVLSVSAQTLIDFAPASGRSDTERSSGAQAGDELPLQRPSPLDVEGLVDGLVRDAHGLIIREIDPESVRDLLRAPRIPGSLTTAPPSGRHDWRRTGKGDSSRRD